MWDGWTSQMIFSFLKPQEVGKKRPPKFSQPKKRTNVLTGTANCWWFLFHQKYWISFCVVKWDAQTRLDKLLPNVALLLWIKAWLIYLTSTWCYVGHRGSIKDGGFTQQNRNSRSFTDESGTEEGKEQDCTRVSMCHSCGEHAKKLERLWWVGRCGEVIFWYHMWEACMKLVGSCCVDPVTLIIIDSLNCQSHGIWQLITVDSHWHFLCCRSEWL